MFREEVLYLHFMDVFDVMREVPLVRKLNVAFRTFVPIP